MNSSWMQIRYLNLCNFRVLKRWIPSLEQSRSDYQKRIQSADSSCEAEINTIRNKIFWRKPPTVFWNKNLKILPIYNVFFFPWLYLTFSRFETKKLELFRFSYFKMRNKWKMMVIHSQRWRYCIKWSR